MDRNFDSWCLPEAPEPVKRKSQERHRGENQGPITKRSRPTHTQAHRAMNQRDDKEPDEGKLGLLLEKALSIKGRNEDESILERERDARESSER